MGIQKRSSKRGANAAAHDEAVGLYIEQLEQEGQQKQQQQAKEVDANG